MKSLVSGKPAYPIVNNRFAGFLTYFIYMPCKSALGLILRPDAHYGWQFPHGEYPIAITSLRVPSK